MSELKMQNTNDFLDSITQLVHKEVIKNTSQNPQFSREQNPYLKMARIDPKYSGYGRPRLIFPGDQQPSGKAYPYLSLYTPEADDYVLIARTHGTWVIIGKII